MESRNELCASGAEFLILLTGMDETFSQVVNTRSSYRANEVIWDAKFTDIFVYDPEGRMAGIDMKRFHDTARISTQPSRRSPPLVFRSMKKPCRFTR